MDIPKPELLPDGAREHIELVGLGPAIDLVSVRIFTASATVAAGDPLAMAFGASGMTVEPIDGTVSTDIAWAGVAANAAASGEEVAVVIQGPAVVNKATGTAWAEGDVIGADTGAAATCTVSSQDLDGTNVAKKDLGWGAAADAGDDTGTVWVSI